MRPLGPAADRRAQGLQALHRPLVRVRLRAQLRGLRDHHRLQAAAHARLQELHLLPLHAVRPRHRDVQRHGLRAVQRRLPGPRRALRAREPHRGQQPLVGGVRLQRAGRRARPGPALGLHAGGAVARRGRLGAPPARRGARRGARQPRAEGRDRALRRGRQRADGRCQGREFQQDEELLDPHVRRGGGGADALHG